MAKRPPPVKRPKVTTPKKSQLAVLRERARKASTASRERIQLSIRVGVPLYEALVELAEEQHRSVTEIAAEALGDGVRKYREFSSPTTNPFRAVTPQRAWPEFAGTNPRPPRSLLERARSTMAEDFAGVAPPESPEETSIIDSLDPSVIAKMRKIPLLAGIPSSGAVQVPEVRDLNELKATSAGPAEESEYPFVKEIEELEGEVELVEG